MNLYEAIFARKSVRHFEMEELEDTTLSNIRSYMNQLIPYKSSIGYEMQIVKEAQLKGMFHVKAPYYLIFSSELKQDYLVNAGYLLHQMVLYLTAKNIGTCYQGGVHPSKSQKDSLKYDYVIAIAFGKSSSDIYRLSEKAKRLAPESLIVYKEEVSENMKKIMKAAILSPSSVNNQPWRFVVYSNRIHVFCKKSYFLKSVISDLKLIDMGIVLETIAQAADELWLDTTMVKLDQVKNMDLKKTEYITTILIKEKLF